MASPRTGLPHWRDYCLEGNWATRKLKRKYCYERFEFRNRLRECAACSGAGYYDDRWNGEKCVVCDGTGKVRER